MTKGKDVITHPRIQPRVFVIRDQKVMLDFDLAGIYGVETKALNQAVTRNEERFPIDFMFPLSAEEWESLRSQIVTSSLDQHGGRRYAPRAFTEQGVAMLSSVLRSKRAIAANIQIMRAFVEMREAMISHKDLFGKLADMELRYDQKFKQVFDVLRQMIDRPMMSETPKKRRIGYIHDLEEHDDGDYGRPKGRRR